MNDRIEQLIQKSYGHEDSNGNRYFNKELFAELIVRECAEICLEANDHKNILRHFGMTDLRTAAQRVLDEYDNDSVGFKLFGALEDLRGALAEPVQEPVARRPTMSKKSKAYIASRLGLEPLDNRKAFYAGWDAALAAHGIGVKE